MWTSLKKSHSDIPIYKRWNSLISKLSLIGNQSVNTFWRFPGSKTNATVARFPPLVILFETIQSTRVGNIWFLSPLVLSKWEDLAFSVCRLFGESVFILQFLDDKIYNHVLFDIIVHFIIQKLKNKHTFLKKSRNWES